MQVVVEGSRPLLGPAFTQWDRRWRGRPPPSRPRAPIPEPGKHRWLGRQPPSRRLGRQRLPPLTE